MPRCPEEYKEITRVDGTIMLVIDINSIEPISGHEGSRIRQVLHPNNTLLGIRYSVAHCTLAPRSSTKPHRLKSAEAYYILSGEGIIHVGVESSEVKNGQVVYVPPNAKQFVENRSGSDLKFLCVVDPAWRQEDEISD